MAEGYIRLKAGSNRFVDETARTVGETFWGVRRPLPGLLPFSNGNAVVGSISIKAAATCRSNFTA